MATPRPNNDMGSSKSLATPPYLSTWAWLSCSAARYLDRARTTQTQTNKMSTGNKDSANNAKDCDALDAELDQLLTAADEFDRKHFAGRFQEQLRDIMETELNAFRERFREELVALMTSAASEAAAATKRHVLSSFSGRRNMRFHTPTVIKEVSDETEVCVSKDEE